MKSKVAFWVSIVLNVGLLFAIAYRPKPQPPNTHYISQPTVVTNVIERKTVETVSESKTNLIHLDWRKIEAADYRVYIKNLRGIGCPEETIRDIIIADVNKLYASKWKDLVRPPGAVKYWEPLDGSAGTDPKSEAARQKMDLERRNLIRDLLGGEGDDDLRKQEMTFTSRDLEDRLLDYLSDEKRKEVTAIKAWDRSEVHRIQEQAAAENRALTPEENAEIARIRSEANKQMRAALGDEGFTQYNLRTSLSATQLRNRLVGFNPTETEYVSVFSEETKLKNGLNELKKAGESANTPEQRQVLQSKFEERLQQQMGPDRYQEFLLTQDPIYRQVMSQAQANDIPHAKALTYMQAYREYVQYTDPLIRNPQTGSQELSQKLSAAEAKFREKVGDLWPIFSSKEKPIIVNRPP